MCLAAASGVSVAAAAMPCIRRSAISSGSRRGMIVASLHEIGSKGIGGAAPSALVTANASRTPALLSRTATSLVSGAMWADGNLYAPSGAGGDRRA
jgi:hypothetical protein